MCNTPNQDTEGKNKKTILIAVQECIPRCQLGREVLKWGNKERGGRRGLDWNLDPCDRLGSRITIVVLFYLFHILLGVPVILSFRIRPDESPSSGVPVILSFRIGLMDHLHRAVFYNTVNYFLFFCWYLSRCNLI